MEKPVRNYPQFTHFASIPFIQSEQRNLINNIQSQIVKIFKMYMMQHCLIKSDCNLMHITLAMLILNREELRQSAIKIMNQNSKNIYTIMKGIKVKTKSLKYFSNWNKNTKQQEISVIYLQLQKNQAFQSLQKLIDLLIRVYMKEQIVSDEHFRSMWISYNHKKGKFVNQDLHITLFRIKGLSKSQFQPIFQSLQNQIKCKLQLKCQSVDISTRFHYDSTLFYKPLHQLKFKQLQP